LLGLHAIGIMVVAWTLSSRSGAAQTVGDLLPLFLAPVLYGEIPILISALGGWSGVVPARTYHDVAIQRLEQAIFGGEPSRNLAQRFPSRWLSELLHAGYLAYYLAIFVPPLALFVHGERRAFAQTVVALTITYTICWVLFVFAPVEGPRYLWGANPTVPDGPSRRLALYLLAAGSSRGAAFPSSHMAVMVVQTIMAFRWQPRMAWALAAVTLLVGVGAVYGGFHYAVDMVAGAGLGGAIGAAVLARRWRSSNP
jgi:membrane-associated phospholipid phosphatase